MADYDNNALAALDEWFGQMLESLSPAQRLAQLQGSALAFGWRHAFEHLAEPLIQRGQRVAVIISHARNPS